MGKGSKWDYAKAEKRKPVTNARAAVSVVLNKQEFELVARIAKKKGKKIPTYIRDAAIAYIVEHYGSNDEGEDE